MADDFLYDVFLSHNHKDKPRVRRLAERLRDAGLNVWFDDWNVKPGEIISLKVEEGLEESRVLLLCISPNALASGWVSLERSTAIHRDPSNERRRFIPLLLTECDLPDTLRRYKYVDFRAEEDTAFAELLNACQSGVPRSPSAIPIREVPSQPPKKTRPTKVPKAEKESAVLEYTLKGHTKWVNSVTVSADGKWAASGCDDHTIRIWNLQSGECKATLTGHADGIVQVKFAPDQATLFSCSFDGTIRIWDTRSEKCLRKLKDPSPSVNCLTFLSDEMLLAGTYDGSIRVWNLKTHQRKTTFKLHDSGLSDIAVHVPAGIGLSVANDDIAVWKIHDGTHFETLKGHSAFVRSLQITPDGLTAISSSDDGTIKLWDLKTYSCVGTLEGHQNAVKSIALSPDGSVIVSAGWSDDTVRLWDFKSGQCREVINLAGPSPSSVAYSPDGSRIVVGTYEGTLYVYRVPAISIIPAAEKSRRYVNAKVVLIGEGTMGKTSLAHRLIEDQYVIQDRTHGMNVWRLDTAPAVR